MVAASVDLAFLFAGVCEVKEVCKLAAMAAGDSLPDEVSPGSPSNRADRVIAERQSAVAELVRFDPQCEVSEKLINPLPNARLGGPFQGSVAETVQADIHVPFVVEPIKSWVPIKIRDQCAFTSTLPSSANSVGPTFSQSSSESSAIPDWMVSITTETLKGYLDYKGSLLSPLVKASVVYSQTFCGVTYSEPYESYYYAGFQPVGCIKHHSLDLIDGAWGTIELKSDGSSALSKEETHAAADLIDRVFLDLYLKRCKVRCVVVPFDAFENVMDGLCQYGFQLTPPEGSSQPITAQTILSIVSNPPGLAERIMY